VFDPYKNATYIPNSVNRKVFAMDTDCVVRDGVAQSAYQYQGLFPGGNAAGELS